MKSTIRRAVRKATLSVEKLVGKVWCPACGNKVYRWRDVKRSVGSGGRGRLCPHCGSFERTRHFKLWVEQTDVVVPGVRFLHFAPEAGLEHYLRAALSGSYVTCDIAMSHVDRHEDITALSFEDGCFDFIYCSNVLEHVIDDRAAMSELYRVLRVGGTAFIQVPIRGATTYEDFSITDPVERDKHFGQSDHVRYYGEDIVDRLRLAGFDVMPTYMPDELRVHPADIARMNLGKRELVHICGKAA